MPGSGITSLSWEGGGLRIALAVEAYIYFANIRPDYKWGYLKCGASGTIVYAFTRPDRTDSTVMFWDVGADERQSASVAGLRLLAAAGDNCAMVAAQPGGFSVSLCSSIGSPVEAKTLPNGLSPLAIAMTPLHVLVADGRCVYIWQYRTPVLKLTAAEVGEAVVLRAGRERVVDVLDSPDSAVTTEAFVYPPSSASTDRICALAASDKVMVVALESGALLVYSLPHVTLEQRATLRSRAALVRLNCDSTLLAVVDTAGVLSVVDLQGRPISAPDGKELERKDVWDACWSADNPRSFAAMEKTRMFVFEDLLAQEPSVSSGYLAHYSGLEACPCFASSPSPPL